MPKVLLALIVAFVVCQVALACTTIYLHRALAHKSLTLSPPVRMVFRVMLWLMTGIRPRQWVAVHRKHHAYTDVEGDPHSPLLLGFWKVQLGNVMLYRKSVRDGETTQRYAKDLPPDRLDKVLFDHAFIGLGIGITALCLVFGWEVGLIAAGIHTVLYLAINSAVNAIGHRFGSKSYENTARNNQWLAWLTVGEGLHNNHHAAPTSAKFALNGHQIDPGWWIIRGLVRTGQAKVRLNELRLVKRAETTAEAATG